MSRICIPATFPFLAGVLLLLLTAGATLSEEARPARTDLYGDPLPAGAVVRFGTTRLRHSYADRLMISKDGKQLTSFNMEEKSLRVWGLASGKLVEQKHTEKRPAWTELPREKIARLPKPERLERYWATALSPDGKLVAAIVKDRREEHYEDGEVHLWETATGREIGKKDDSLQGESLAFSPDSKTLAVGRCEGGEVRLFDSATLKETGTLPGIGITKGLSFSPDGRFLVGSGGERDVVGGIGFAFSGKGVYLWDLKGNRKPRQLIKAGVEARFAFTPDGKTLACASWGSEIFLWELPSGRPLLQRPGHGLFARALAVSPDGKFASSIAGDGLYLWKTETGEALHRLSVRGDRAPVCLFSSDGKRLITAGPGGSLQVWDVSSGDELRRLRPRNASGKPITVEAAGISPDGNRLSAVFSIGQTYRGQPSDNDGLLLVWDLTNGKELARRPYKLQSHPLIEAYRERGVFPADVLFCALFDPPPAQAWGTVHAAFAPGGEVLTEWQGQQVGLVEVSSGRRLAMLPKRVGQRLLFSPDGRLVAAASLRPRFKDHPDDGDAPGGVSLVEAATGEEITRLDITAGWSGRDWAFAFTPDSSALVVADQNNLRVWDTANGERLHQMAWPDGLHRTKGKVNVSSLTLLSGGRAIIGFEDGQVLVWDLASASWTRGKSVRDLSRDNLERLWADLAVEAGKAHQALHTLSAAPAQSVPFLQDRLQPATAVDPKRVEKLLAGLEDKKFSAREAAVRELTELRDRIEPLLHKAIKDQPTLETRRRIEALLAEPFVPTVETRRTLRAVAALERIGNSEARRLLERLSSGADSTETRAAMAALDRLKHR
jgi:WD40 repeat protein